MRRVAIIASASGNGNDDLAARSTRLGVRFVELDALVHGRESLFGYALSQQPRRRREYPVRYAGRVRCAERRDVERWMADTALP